MERALVQKGAVTKSSHHKHTIGHISKEIPNFGSMAGDWCDQRATHLWLPLPPHAAASLWILNKGSPT